METDALETSHSVSVEVENPNQIFKIFDAISYTKGQFNSTLFFSFKHNE